MKDFFISYNGADRAWAEWIAWQLEGAGHSVVIQAWDFRQGGNFVLDMQRAVEEAQRTIIVLSPDFLAAKASGLTWTQAYEERQREARIAASIKRAEARAAALGGSATVGVIPDHPRPALAQAS